MFWKSLEAAFQRNSLADVLVYNIELDFLKKSRDFYPVKSREREIEKDPNTIGSGWMRAKSAQCDVYQGISKSGCTFIGLDIPFFQYLCTHTHGRIEFVIGAFIPPPRAETFSLLLRRKSRRGASSRSHKKLGRE
jgi:hypothetical protein